MTQYVLNLMFGFSITLLGVSILGLLKSIKGIRESNHEALDLLFKNINEANRELYEKNQILYNRHAGSTVYTEAIMGGHQASTSGAIGLKTKKPHSKVKNPLKKINKNKENKP